MMETSSKIEFFFVQRQLGISDFSKLILKLRLYAEVNQKLEFFSWKSKSEWKKFHGKTTKTNKAALN